MSPHLAMPVPPYHHHAMVFAQNLLVHVYVMVEVVVVREPTKVMDSMVIELAVDLELVVELFSEKYDIL